MTERRINLTNEEKTEIEEYPLNFIEAWNKAKEGYDIQTKRYLPFYAKNGKLLCRNNMNSELDLESFFNEKFKVLPKEITWYEADKVHLTRSDIVIEFEAIGKSKEDVIKYIDQCTRDRFKVLNWKTHTLPSDPNDWHK